MGPWRVAVLLAAGVAAALGCYHPREVDCVLACDAGGACPGGSSCSAGFCTRGPSCVIEIASGARHSCALRAGGVQCWGNGAYGQLGIGSTENRGNDDGAPIAPAVLGAGRSAIAVTAGGRHTCAIVRDGASAGAATSSVFCWGDDSFGQLGTADGLGRLAPGDGSGAVVLGGRSPTAVAAGLDHTCALFDDRTVACWGDNRFGQLGVAGPGPGIGAGGPTSVALGSEAIAVAAGAYHSCALLLSGAVRCWGWNDYGQLGDEAQPGGDIAPGDLVDVPLPNGQPALSIAAGAFHSCAVLSDGTVTCWGQNDAGQIGVPKDPSQPHVSPGTSIDLGTGRSALQVTAGTSHTCARLDDFSVKCWGFDSDGELGIGANDNRGDNESLGDALPRVSLDGTPASDLAAGAHHTCAIVASSVRCWGFGDSGRLGVGDSLNQGDEHRPRIAPVLLADPTQ